MERQAAGICPRPHLHPRLALRGGATHRWERGAHGHSLGIHAQAVTCPASASTITPSYRDFPGGPVVKTLRFHCRGLEWVGSLARGRRSHMLRSTVTKKKKKRKYHPTVIKYHPLLQKAGKMDRSSLCSGSYGTKKEPRAMQVLC